MMMPCQQARDTRRQLPSPDLASKNCGLRPKTRAKNSAAAAAAACQTTQIGSAWRISSFIFIFCQKISARHGLQIASELIEAGQYVTAIEVCPNRTVFVMQIKGFLHLKIVISVPEKGIFI